MAISSYLSRSLLYRWIRYVSIKDLADEADWVEDSCSSVLYSRVCLDVGALAVPRRFATVVAPVIGSNRLALI